MDTKNDKKGLTKDKVQGMFLGVAIGDALGMPVEMFSAERIATEHGRIENYLSAAGHKWFDGEPLGSWTDDTQLTLAVAEALIDADGFDMRTQVKRHIEAFDAYTRGWGTSTRESIKALKEGKHWTEAALSDDPKRGKGNGVVMKISPLAPFFKAKEMPWFDTSTMIGELALMTHRTSIAVSSALAHTYGLIVLLAANKFDLDEFVGTITKASRMGEEFCPDSITEDDLKTRLEELRNHTKWDKARLIEEWKGSCYVYDSLPFSYMFFVKNPNSIECLYEVVSAGKDTDSNGSIVGSLLGALHGVDIFPKHLLEGLQFRDQIIDVADRLCSRFGIT